MEKFQDRAANADTSVCTKGKHADRSLSCLLEDLTNIRFFHNWLRDCPKMLRMVAFLNLLTASSTCNKGLYWNLIIFTSVPRRFHGHDARQRPAHQGQRWKVFFSFYRVPLDFQWLEWKRQEHLHEHDSLETSAWDSRLDWSRNSPKTVFSPWSTISQAARQSKLRCFDEGIRCW